METGGIREAVRVVMTERFMRDWNWCDAQGNVCMSRRTQRFEVRSFPDRKLASLTD